jgi:hypothetical protein
MWSRSSPCERIFAFHSERVLTFSTFRLNNRDTLRARCSDDNWNDDFHISSSFRQNVYKSKSGQTAVSFAAVDPTVTAEFARSTNDSDNEPGLDISVRVLHTFAVLWDWDDCFSGGHNHRLCARSITRVRCVGSWLTCGNGVVCTKMSEQSMISILGPL